MAGSSCAWTAGRAANGTLRRSVASGRAPRHGPLARRRRDAAARAARRHLRRATARAGPTATWVPDRARLQPARARARRRVRRDPRRRDELRRRTARSSRVTAPPPSTCAYQTMRRAPRRATRSTVRGEVVRLAEAGRATWSRRCATPTAPIVSRATAHLPASAASRPDDRRHRDPTPSPVLPRSKRWRYGWIAEAVGDGRALPPLRLRPRAGRRHDGGGVRERHATSSPRRSSSASTGSARSSRRSSTPTGSSRSGTSTTAPSTSCCRSSRSCGCTARCRRATCAGATRSC